MILVANKIYAQADKPLFKNLNRDFSDIDISVMDILRDSRGFVWMTGKQYLQRFDGVEVKKYALKEYPLVQNVQALNLIREDSRKNLWVYFLGMMLLWDPVYDDFFYFEFDIPVNEYSERSLITTIAEDRRGNLWIAYSNYPDYPIVRIPVDTLTKYVRQNPDDRFPTLITRDKFDYIPAAHYNDKEIDKLKYAPIIWNILFDLNDNIWIEREGWLDRYVENDAMKPGIFIRYLETRNGEDRILNRMEKNQERVGKYTFLDKYGRLWVLTANRLYQFLGNPEQKRILKDSVIRFNEFYQSLYSDYRQNRNSVFNDIWINTYELGPDLNYYLSFYFDRDNLLWLQKSPYEMEVYSMSISKLGPVEINRISEFESIPSDPCNWQYVLYPLFLDEEGILWLADRDWKGNIAGGVLTLNTKDMNRYRKVYHNPSNPSSIPLNEIGPMLRDYKGNSWFFPYSFRHTENIVYWTDHEFSEFQVINIPEDQNEPTGDFLNQVWEDSRHRMWIVGGSNIHVIDLPAFYANKKPQYWHHHFNTSNFLTPQEGDQIIVHDLYLDKTDNLWIYAILYNDLNPNRDFIWGLYFYDTDQLKNIRLDQYKNIRFQKFDQYKDPGDTLFFGCYNTGVLKYWDTWKPEFAHQNINNVYLLSNIALIRIDPVTRDYDIFRTGNTNPGSDNLDISNGTMVIDDSASDSITVYGTLNTGGLVSYTFDDRPARRSLKSKHIFRDRDGLKYNTWKLLRDKNGNIWSHVDQQGILKYDPLNDSFNYFTNEYTVGGWSYCGGHYLDSDGYMYLQSSDGITIFHPDSLLENSFIPPVNITDIRIMEHSIIREKDSVHLNRIKMNHSLTIPYNQNMISLDFNAVSLWNVQKNRYQYFMEGWDDNWISAEYSNRTITYSNLSPGHYTFRVKGSNNDGIWNEAGASLNVVILPPWWLTWWAKAAYVMLFVGAIWGFIYLRTRKQKRKLMEMQQINDAFSKFVPYEFLHAIGREYIMDVRLGDKTYQDVTVLFLDIRNYTTLAESMTPDDNFSFIQKFVGLMGPIIISNGGFVNQYLGDGIMAIFPGKVDDALRAAIEMQKALDGYNQRRAASRKEKIRMGVGLHTGPLIMGIIGDEKRSDPATIADTVNTASRLEGMTKYYGVRILLSGESLQLLKSSQDYHIRYLGEVVVKGKNRPVKVYECFDGDDEYLRNKKLETLQKFEKGLAYYYQKDFSRASLVFNDISLSNPDDWAAGYFSKKASVYASDGVPEEWTGVEKMEVK